MTRSPAPPEHDRPPAEPGREAAQQFRRAYAEHRAAEGRAFRGEALLSLPYLRRGPLAREWAVRARSYRRLMDRLRRLPSAAPSARLRVLDLGAGSGWLSHRLVAAGMAPVAVDTRTDDVDGLGVVKAFDAHVPRRIPAVAAAFDALPFRAGSFDVVAFNASLHCAGDLRATLGEATRILARPGRIFVVDSPFYRREADGEAMVEAKRRTAPEVFGARAGILMALPSVEYLTRARLERATPGVSWRRHRVRYPLWYEARPVVARLRRRRAPSRFDVWEGVVV